MRSLAILVVGFALLFGCLALLGTVVTGKLLQRVVFDRHEALNEILDTGAVPQAWTERYEKKILRLSHHSGPGPRIDSVRARAADAHLRRLDRLRRYVAVSSVVDSEETRKAVLDQLAETRSKWQSEKR